MEKKRKANQKEKTFSPIIQHQDAGVSWAAHHPDSACLAFLLTPQGNHLMVKVLQGITKSLLLAAWAPSV